MAHFLGERTLANLTIGYEDLPDADGERVFHEFMCGRPVWRPVRLEVSRHTIELFRRLYVPERVPATWLGSIGVLGVEVRVAEELPDGVVRTLWSNGDVTLGP